jgi:hypothetical protein
VEKRLNDRRGTLFHFKRYPVLLAHHNRIHGLLEDDQQICALSMRLPRTKLKVTRRMAGSEGKFQVTDFGYIYDKQSLPRSRTERSWDSVWDLVESREAFTDDPKPARRCGLVGSLGS